MPTIPDELPMIGPASLTLLRRNGVSNAANVLSKGEEGHSEIPGFGAAKWAVLFDWACHHADVEEIEALMRVHIDLLDALLEKHKGDLASLVTAKDVDYSKYDMKTGGSPFSCHRGEWHFDGIDDRLDDQLNGLSPWGRKVTDEWLHSATGSVSRWQHALNRDGLSLVADIRDREERILFRFDKLIAEAIRHNTNRNRETIREEQRADTSSPGCGTAALALMILPLLYRVVL